MPYQHIKYKIPPQLDRRIKLQPKDKKKIRQLFAQNTPIRAIARLYAHKCCRRTIQFTIYPEKIKKTDNKKYYDKDRHNKYIREHHQYKQQLFLANKLT